MAEFTWEINVNVERLQELTTAQVVAALDEEFARVKTKVLRDIAELKDRKK